MVGDGRAWLAAQPLAAVAREQMTVALGMIGALDWQPARWVRSCAARPAAGRAHYGVWGADRVLPRPARTSDQASLHQPARAHQQGDRRCTDRRRHPPQRHRRDPPRRRPRRGPRNNKLEQALKRLERFQVLIVAEIDYLRPEWQATSLHFALVFGRWARSS